MMVRRDKGSKDVDNQPTKDDLPKIDDVTWVRLPKHRWPKEWNALEYEDPVVPLLRRLPPECSPKH